MLALLSARFRRLLVLMIAVPIGGRLLDTVGRRLETSRGPTRVSRTLRSGGRAAGRVSRGPLRPRHAPDRPTTPPPGASPNGRRAAATSRRRR